jgi:hypothetical protein
MGLPGTSAVVNTYRLWLRHKLFRGWLDQNQFEFGEQAVFQISQVPRNRGAR